MKTNAGLLIGLGAIVAFSSSVIFLIALTIVQPLQLQLTPRRAWMDNVKIHWLWIAIGCFAAFSASFAMRMKKYANSDPSYHSEPSISRPRESTTAQDQGHCSSEVWVCNYGASPLGRRIDIEHQTDQDLETLKRYQNGDALDGAALPKTFIYRDRAAPRDVMVCGFVFVSEDVKNSLGEFDLGYDQFLPLDGLLKANTTSGSQKTYSILTLRNRKTVFSAEDSDPAAIRQVARGVPLWNLYVADSADGAIAVTAAALDGPEIWRDPTAPNFIFCSGRVKAALDNHGIGKKVGFRRCRVVGTESQQ